MRRTPGGGFDLGDAGFFGLGLAASLARGYGLSRLRHYRCHGTDVRFAGSPIGARLAKAVALHRETAGDPDQPIAELRDLRLWTPLHVTARGFPAGERLDNTLPIDPTTTRGLGLVGHGADDALHAMIMSLASYRPDTTSPAGELLLSHDDVRALFGPQPPDPLPPSLRLVKSVEEALSELDRLIRERDTQRETVGEQPLVALVLAHQPPGHLATHLATLLQRGAPLGVTALLLGHWAPATVTIHNQFVTATHGALNLAYLTGTRLFAIPHHRAIELWSLLAHHQIPENGPPHTGQTPPTETTTNPG